MQKELSLTSWSRGKHQLAFHYGIDDLTFSTSYWYDSVDLYDLETRYGREFMERIYFHIGAFDINKVASLRPDSINWGPFSDFVTPEFTKLWKTIFENVWAQWRYENDDPKYFGPEFLAPQDSSAITPLEVEPGEVEILLFCGGGKDSLVAMKLLERGGGGGHLIA